MKKKIAKFQVSLKVFIKDKEGRVLALQGKFKRLEWQGMYDFPGGRIDVDEVAVPFEDIVRREVKEECGDLKFTLSPGPVALGHFVIDADGETPEIQVLYVFFEAQLEGGEVTISDEHVGHRWFTDKELKDEAEKLFASGNLEGLKMYLKW